MATSKTKTDVSNQNTEAPRPVLLALDVAERGQATVVAVLQDVRIELRTAVEGTIDLGEKLAAGVVRFARKLAQKVDETAADTLKGTEKVLHDTIESARNTARAGRQLAERAVEKLAA